MTSAVDCPHQRPGIRRCDACVQHCDGEIEGTVSRDSDGDADVIGGMRTFLTVERLSTSCGCILTDAEQKAVIDQYLEDYDAAGELEAMAEDDARREAGF